MHRLVALITAYLIMTPVLTFAQRPDIVIADFEGPDYRDWKVTGEAFGPGPAHGALPGQMGISGFRGKGLVTSFFKGDDTKGTLTSPLFTISRKFVNFLIGGGAHPGETCVNLLINGEIKRSTTGANDENLIESSWEVREFAGRMAQIQIVDNKLGDWGHINVDEIVLSDKMEAEPIKVDELYNESYRPQFHFTAKKNWLNDPNGLVYYKGEYHLFFQHNPESVNWGNMTWGHAVSTDLFHWKQLDHALLPDNLGTMFSGSAVIDTKNTSGFQTNLTGEKPMVCIYTAAGGTSDASKNQPFTQGIAFSLDKGRTWTKYLGNPVLANKGPENRDPKVIWHKPTGKWVMALWVKADGAEGIQFFGSADLKKWEFLSKINDFFECPDIFELPVDGKSNNNRWALLAANGQYRIGQFDGVKFTPETEKLPSDWGANFYASQSYSDIPASDGRRIQIGWMSGGRYPGMPFNQQMTVPCELKLRTTPDGVRMTKLPVREIEKLRGKPVVWADSTVKPGQNLMNGLKGDLWDIEAEIEVGSATEVGFKLRGAKVMYNLTEGKLIVMDKSAQMKPEKSGRVKMRVLLDRTSIEVYGNDGFVAMSSCFVPRLSDHGLEFVAGGGTAKIVSMKAWPLRSVWK